MSWLSFKELQIVGKVNDRVIITASNYSTTCPCPICKSLSEHVTKLIIESFEIGLNELMVHLKVNKLEGNPTFDENYISLSLDAARCCEADIKFLICNNYCGCCKARFLCKTTSDFFWTGEE